MRACFAAIVSLILVASALATDPPKPRKPAKTALPANGVKTPGVRIPFASLKAEAEIPLSGKPAAFAVGESVWVLNRSENAIQVIATRSNKPGEPIAGLKEPCSGLLPAFRSLWAPSCADGTLVRLDAKEKKIQAAIPTEGSVTAKSALAATADSVWLLADDKTNLVRVDPEDNRIVAYTRLPPGCSHLLSADSALWVSCPKENKVYVVDPLTNLIEQRIEVAAEPGALTFGEGAVWVLCEREGKVARIVTKTKKVEDTVELGIPNSGGDIAYGEGSVWVTSAGFPISRIHPESKKVVQQFYGDGGGAIFTGAGSLWLWNQDAGSLWRIDPRRVAATLAE